MSVYDWIKMHASTHGYGSKLAPYTCAAELIHRNHRYLVCHSLRGIDVIILLQIA